MNVIILFKGGLIVNSPILVKCSTRATAIYLDLAKNLGVEIPTELTDKITYDDTALSTVIDYVDTQLEWTGDEIKWFDVDPLKKLK